MRVRCVRPRFRFREYRTVLLLTVSAVFLTGFLIIGNYIKMIQMLQMKYVLPNTGGFFESHAIKLNGRSLTALVGKHDWNNDNQKSTEAVSTAQTVYKILAGIFFALVFTYLMMGIFTRLFQACSCRKKEPKTEMFNFNRGRSISFSYINIHDEPLSEEGQIELGPCPSTHVTFNDNIMKIEAASNAKAITCLEALYASCTSCNNDKSPGGSLSDGQESVLHPHVTNNARELQSAMKKPSTDVLTVTNVLTSEAAVLASKASKLTPEGSDPTPKASGPTREASDPIPETSARSPSVENVEASLST